MARVRSEVQVWLARTWLADDPARALAHARDAQPAMQADDDNAARRWMLAQAQGEEAAALAALGRGAEATAAARRALQSWREATPQGEPPAMYAALVARDRQGAASR
jgi:hypothetical protein